MDRRFFKSKEFAIALVIALVLLAASAVAATEIAGVGLVAEEGCTVPAPAGQGLDATVEDSGPFREDGRVKRVVTYRLGAGELAGGTVDVCTDVGDVDVMATSSDAVEVTFTLANRGDGARDAVERAEVEALFAEDAGELSLAAWQAQRTKTGSFFDEHTTHLDVEIALPASMRTALDVDTDVGDITLSMLKLSSVGLRTDVGDIDGQSLDIVGDVDARTDVGDLTLAASSLDSGTWEIRTDVGDAELHLPEPRDIGYDVDASADVGSVDVEIGPTEEHRSESEGPSEDVHARSQGYSTKRVQVTVEVDTDVGDIDVIAGGSR